MIISLKSYRMKKTKKIAIYGAIVMITLAIILLIANTFNNNSYRNQIPVLPDFTTLSAPIKEQLSLANNKAQDSPSADNIGMLGMAYHSCALYDQATQCYKLAIKASKSKWKWNYYLGYLNQEMGDSKAAIEYFDSVIKENPEAIQAWYYLGKAYQNLANDDKAEAAFNQIAYLNEDITKVRSVRINYFSLPVSAKFELARIYLNTKRLDKAEKILEEVIQKNHNVGPVYRLLGNVYSAKGDSVLSKKFIVRAQDLADVTAINDTLIDRISLISRSELYLPKQIDAALNSANPEWALQLFKQAFLYLPDDKYLILKAIKYYLRMNNGEEALPYLKKNFNDFKDNIIEMNSIAELLFMNRFYLQAIPYYTQAEKLKPQANEHLENFALCYWKQNKKDSALTLMNEQYEKYKNNPIVLSAEVDFMLKVGDKVKAKSLLLKLRQIAPSDPKALKLSGIIAEMEGNQNDAIQMYEAAFKGDPTDLENIQKLENILIGQRLWSKAITLAKSSLKHHPNSFFLMERLGTLLISCPDPNLRNLQEGIEFSGRAFYHIASNSYTIISSGKNLAQGYAMLGEFKTAAYYISITLNMAKSEKVSNEYLQALLNLASEIKKYNKK
jgi:tetratricopeptide (TPR) repeat protein